MNLMKIHDISPIHPGEFLLEDFLKPLGLSQTRLAKAICVPPRRINEIILGKRSITADTALRLSHYFKTSPSFWMSMQTRYDLDLRDDKIHDEIELLEVCAVI